MRWLSPFRRREKKWTIVLVLNEMVLVLVPGKHENQRESSTSTAVG